MDIQSQTTQPISDDQELAKVLAGVNADIDADSNNQDTNTTPGTPPAATPPADDPMATPMPAPATGVSAPVAPPTMPGELDGVKQEAISELRPLVDKLNLPAEEKFDTYLLLIRSTDDRTLIAPAHEAAKAIADEARRAQALLDIIKEIDFLSGNQPTA